MKTGNLHDEDYENGFGPRNRSPQPAQDYWKIKKVLTRSDVDGSSRLLLAKPLVRDHIQSHLKPENTEALFRDGGEADVAIWDVDTQTEHALVLKSWKTGSFILRRNRVKDFVSRRDLEEKDEIGLRWDDGNYRLEFSLLSKGIQTDA